MESLGRLQKRLKAARGEIPSDLYLTNGYLIDVYSGIVTEKNIAIYDGIIVGAGEYSAVKTIDLNGMYISPGFIESHIHIESSKLIPSKFAEVAIKHGTTCVIADPHEIANVLGIEGIEFMIQSASESSIDIFFMLPSCVPATNMETSGANLNAENLECLLQNPMILGIGELMNFPGAYLGDESTLRKSLLGQNSMVDGHAPGLTGKNLNAYLLAGPKTDHECSDIEEAAEKLSKGMYIQIREGSTAKNLDSLAQLIDEKNERRILLVSDDRSAGDLIEYGHLDYTVRLLVDLGVDPVSAIRMVTLNPAEAYGLRDRGGIFPGARADFVVLEDLDDFQVKAVYKDGKQVVKNGKNLEKKNHKSNLPEHTVKISSIEIDQLRIIDKQKPVRIIDIIPDQIVTGQFVDTLSSRDGFLQCDPAKDILKICVIERHTGKAGLCAGFVRGLGITGGAIASTVAHDSHNVIAAGDNDESILTAIQGVQKIDGGQVVVSGKKVIAELPLPVAGLMSDKNGPEVAKSERKLLNAAKKLKCAPEDPFMALSFLALPVIPSLKITDKGLVDVNKFEVVSLFVD